MEHQHEQNNNTFFNWLLAICAGMFKYISDCSAEEIYTWIFRALTLVSISLIIIINIPKAWDVIKTPFKRKL